MWLGEAGRTLFWAHLRMGRKSGMRQGDSVIHYNEVFYHKLLEVKQLPSKMDQERVGTEEGT